MALRCSCRGPVDMHCSSSQTTMTVVIIVILCAAQGIDVVAPAVAAYDEIGHASRFRFPDREERLKGFTADLDGEDVFADTTYGRLRGKRRHGEPLAGGETSVVDWFIGVPYAKPPTGPLRFRATVAPNVWEGTRDALRFSNVCPQPLRNNNFTIFQDEDCLYLNIYSPFPGRNYSAESQSSYPVMVYIHGGSYRVGAGSYFLGHILAQYGVVVVTLNYRLGVLGFLSARDKNLRGNYGLYDQIEALKWIAANIGSFRGDPTRVTIFGNSAGGASVGILCVSPLAKGLFKYAIIESGSPLSFWAVHNQSADLFSFVQSLSVKLSCDQEQVSDMVACLRHQPWKKLVNAANDMPDITPSRTNIRPVPDGKVILDMPRKEYATGQFNGQSLMAGIVDAEMTKHMGMFFLDELNNIDEDFNDGFERESFVRVIPYVMNVKFGYNELISDLVLHKYTNWSYNIADPYENRQQYVNFLTDLSMWSPTVELASYVSKANRPTFLFTMRLDPAAVAAGGWKTNHHQLELVYVFGSPFTGLDVDMQTLRDSYTDEDRNISRIMMSLWSNFAKTGNPSRDLRGQQKVNWTEYRDGTIDYLRIVSTKVTMETNHRPEYVAFWNDLIVHANEKLSGVKHQGSHYGNDWSLATLILCLFQALILVILLILILVRVPRRRRTER